MSTDPSDLIPSFPDEKIASILRDYAEGKGPGDIIERIGSGVLSVVLGSEIERFIRRLLTDAPGGMTQEHMLELAGWFAEQRMRGALASMALRGDLRVTVAGATVTFILNRPGIPVGVPA